MKHVYQVFSFIAWLLGSTSVLAVPSLQLWSDPNDGAVWDSVTSTWVIDESTSSTFSLTAFALEEAFLPDTGKTAYLSFTIFSDTFDEFTDPDLFGSISDTGDLLTGNPWIFGTPPVDVTANKDVMARHGIFPAWFIEMSFDFGSLGSLNVFQTQFTDTNYLGSVVDGYRKDFTVDFSGLGEILRGSVVHIDLYTINSDGSVNRFAPFSHDAEVTVPEPSTIALFGLGLFLMGGARIRRKQKMGRSNSELV